MPTVEKVSGPRVYVRRVGTEFSPGDRVDVSDAEAQYLLEERGDFELVDDGEGTDDAPDGEGAEDGVKAPFDPSEYTVDELRDELDDADYGASELHALAAAEERGQDRTTALETIEAHIPNDEEA